MMEGATDQYDGKTLATFLEFHDDQLAIHQYRRSSLFDDDDDNEEEKEEDKANSYVPKRHCSIVYEDDKGIHHQARKDEDEEEEATAADDDKEGSKDVFSHLLLLFLSDILWLILDLCCSSLRASIFFVYGLNNSSPCK